MKLTASVAWLAEKCPYAFTLPEVPEYCLEKSEAMSNGTQYHKMFELAFESPEAVSPEWEWVIDWVKSFTRNSRLTYAELVYSYNVESKTGLLHPNIKDREYKICPGSGMIWGTADLVVDNVIYEYKTGSYYLGQLPNEMMQMKIAALAINAKRLVKVCIGDGTIEQYQVYDLEDEDLKKWASEVRQLVGLVEIGDLLGPNPGMHCGQCKSALFCEKGIEDMREMGMK